MDKLNKKIIALGRGGGGSGDAAVNLSMSIDNDYIITAYLIDKNGQQIGDVQTIDLPLESVVVDGEYDSATQSLILELENGNTVTIPISGLISGLQATIDANNPLNADYLTDGTTNKVYTATEQSKLANIESGAEVNVQADWNQSDNTSDDFIKNKPTIPTVNDSTITLEDSNHTTIDSFTLNQGSNKTITLPSGGGNSWYGTQAQFDSLSSYDDDTDYFITDKIDYNTDIKHKPNLNVYATKTEVNTKNAEQDNVIAGKIGAHFMTQQEFDALGNNVPEGENYFIEGNTIEVVVTFTDQSTATYNVVVD